MYTALKRAANGDLRWTKTAARNRKHGKSAVLRKKDVFRLHLKESRAGFCRRGRGRSFRVDGPKTEKALREPTKPVTTKTIFNIVHFDAQPNSCYKLKLHIWLPDMASMKARQWSDLERSSVTEQQTQVYPKLDVCIISYWAGTQSILLVFFLALRVFFLFFFL